MRRVWGVAAAALLAAAADVFANSARAGDEAAADPRLLLFASTDLWRHGGFAHGGVVWSPAGVDQEGLALKLVFGGGIYQYLSEALGNSQVTGRMLAAAILPGWRFKQGTAIITAYAGLDLQRHELSPDDPAASLRGNYIGGRGSVEFWYEPTPAIMVAADATVSTIGPSYSVRAATGAKVFNSFYLGPEVKAVAVGNNYQQFRAGLQVTGFKTPGLEWSAGLGWVRDSDERSGVYGTIGVLARR